MALRFLFLIVFAFIPFVLAGCGGQQKRTDDANSPSIPAHDAPTIIVRPAAIVEMMGRRGDQDKALPELKIYEPKAGAVLNTSTVRISLELGGILKGFELSSKSPSTEGNHIRVVLDNNRWGEIRNIDEPFEFRDVADGEHTITAVPVRPWGESYKNDGAVQTVKFTVKNGGVAASPDNVEQADVESGFLTLISPSTDSANGLANPVMVDFALSNVRLADRFGNYRVAISINGGTAQFLDKYEPVWISGFRPGSNKIRLELVDRNGKLVKNGTWNSIEREFSVIR